MSTALENSENFVVVAITQEHAAIFKDGIGSTDLPTYIRPPVEVDHRHVRTGQDKHGHDTAHRYPEYFEEIVDQLRGFTAILVMGHGEGKSSKAHEFLSYLERKHPDIRSKVFENLSVNLPAMSEAEIKRDARQWLEKNFRKLATWHNRTPSKWFKG